MSFMPNVGSLVRLADEGIAVVTRVSPDGKDDRVQRFGASAEERTTAYDIKEVLHEPSPDSLAGAVSRASAASAALSVRHRAYLADVASKTERAK